MREREGDVNDDLPPFSEVQLMSKLFTSRAREKMGKLDKLSGAVGGIVELIKLIVQGVRDRKKPPRARDIFAENPSELEATQREAGRTMVGEPEGE
jgi:hypothetical protein